MVSKLAAHVIVAWLLKSVTSKDTSLTIQFFKRSYKVSHSASPVISVPSTDWRTFQYEKKVWAVRAAEKKKSKLPLLRAVFYAFIGQKTNRCFDETIIN